MPTFDEADIVAMTVLLSLVVRAEDERTAADVAAKEAAERSKVANRDVTARRAAFAAFGFDISASNLWPTVRAVMGEEAWKRAIARARSPLPAPAEDTKAITHQPAPEKQEEPTPEAESTPETHEDERAMDADGLSIREIVVAQLSSAGEVGCKAADIRAFVESAHHRSIHEKTIGMTLYRLSKDGIVRRDGRTWFLVTPPAETRNPGVGAPGSETATH